jgi:uncharacterized membrane protein YgdD (TMEM256/DUF423 family)
MNAKGWVVIAAMLGGLAVIAGAFGAHALPGWLKNRGLDDALVLRRQESLEIGVRYQMYHALALLAVAWIQSQTASRMTTLAGVLWLVGILLFSGCLYGYVLSGFRPLAMIVPIGGISFIAGWCALAVAAARTL